MNMFRVLQSVDPPNISLFIRVTSRLAVENIGSGLLPERENHSVLFCSSKDFIIL